MITLPPWRLVRQEHVNVVGDGAEATTKPFNGIALLKCPLSTAESRPRGAIEMQPVNAYATVFKVLHPLVAHLQGFFHGPLPLPHSLMTSGEFQGELMITGDKYCMAYPTGGNERINPFREAFNLLLSASKCKISGVHENVCSWQCLG
uniref:Uncharacterized protein n=1 Tax=Chrysotila carterae TaxID=13221 RepID=A0A7S4BZY0_CHRCT